MSGHTSRRVEADHHRWIGQLPTQQKTLCLLISFSASESCLALHQTVRMMRLRRTRVLDVAFASRTFSMLRPIPAPAPKVLGWHRHLRQIHHRSRPRNHWLRPHPPSLFAPSLRQAATTISAAPVFRPGSRPATKCRLVLRAAIPFWI